MKFKTYDEEFTGSPKTIEQQDKERSLKRHQRLKLGGVACTLLGVGLTTGEVFLWDGPFNLKLATFALMVGGPLIAEMNLLSEVELQTQIEKISTPLPDTSSFRSI